MYFIIGTLIIFYIVWTWKSTSEFETTFHRISYIFVGTAFMIILTLILFQISKIGVNYPKEEMIGQVRKIILLVFVPINSFITLTQSANIITQVKAGIAPKKDLQRKTKTLVVIFFIMIIIEAIYLKSIQNGIIGIINAK